MERKRAIEIIEQRELCMECVVKDCKCEECEEAFAMAIASLKTDEAYQLEYEGVHNIVITDGMTNGDVMMAMFPNEVKDVDVDWFGEDWWNSPYKKEQTDGKA